MTELKTNNTKISEWLDVNDQNQIRWVTNQIIKNANKWGLNLSFRSSNDYQFCYQSLNILSKSPSFDTEYKKLLSRWASHLHNGRKKKELNDKKLKKFHFELSYTSINQLKKLTKDREFQNESETIEALIFEQYDENMKIKNEETAKRNKANKQAFELKETFRRGTPSKWVSRLIHNKLKNDMIRIEQELICVKTRLSEKDLFINDAVGKIDIILQRTEKLKNE
jgi:Arc/MetJ-type ribon-helix-helix transcriptional regulator